MSFQVGRGGQKLPILPSTGKSLSEALLFAEHGENMLCTKIVLNVRSNFCTQHVLPRFELGIFMYWTCNSMNKMSSYCGLVDAKIRASDKDLPVANVPQWLWGTIESANCVPAGSTKRYQVSPPFQSPSTVLLSHLNYQLN